MTPDELRSLADEATPGPWATHPNSRNGEVQYVWDEPTRGEKLDAHIRYEAADARLIALAPDLARLCAEYAGAFEQIAKLHPKDRAESTFIAQRALAKLSELESVT